MAPSSSTVLRVALPVPLRRTFEYLADADRPPAPGLRVRVPFGKRGTRVGMIVDVSAESEFPRDRLKPVMQVLDSEPLLSDADFAFRRWASEYYHHPLGEVIFGTLPAALRSGRRAERNAPTSWRLTARGSEARAGDFRRAPRQWALISLLQAHPRGITEQDLKTRHRASRRVLNALLEAELIEPIANEERVAREALALDPITLNPDQDEASRQIRAATGAFRPFLLHGVTGSGKTEVYLDVIREVVASGRQALMLVPEIGLTPQIIERVRSRIVEPLVVLHSGLSDSDRLRAWIDARDGRASVVLGTRSAVWTPLRDPGLIVIDEEHDLSYKQQEGFRYSARDVAIMRAKRLDIPIVLGSATPSMETLHNCRTGRFTEIELSGRAGNAKPPDLRILDIRNRAMHGALSDTMIEAVSAELKAGRQTLLFLNRRGFSPVLICHHCGWVPRCRRCEVPLTFHKRRQQLLCHHCGLHSVRTNDCEDCGERDMIPIGYGTERIAETLSERFPEARVIRIDRDSTRPRGAMERMVRDIRSGQADILIGTQMLTKGHDFPNLTLVGIIDADNGLFSADFRAGERMAQLIVQVSGRAGRARHAGRVLVQTHYPDHPLLRSMIEKGYREFAMMMLEERRSACLPPFSRLMLLRAEEHSGKQAQGFLDEARALLETPPDGIEVFGPVPAPMEMRAGRRRYQLLIQAAGRGGFGGRINEWLQRVEALPSARRVRWSVDVDPQDMI